MTNGGETESSQPHAMAMFPLSSVLFPGSPLPLRVFEPRYRQMITDVMTTDRRFGVVLIARGSEVGGGDERLSVGTLAEIEALSPTGEGELALLARGLTRLRVTRWLEDDPYPRAEVEHLYDRSSRIGPAEVSGATKRIRSVRALLSELHDTPPLPADLELPTHSEELLAKTMWTLCSLAPFDSFDRQRLLEAPTAEDRLALLVGLCDELAQDLAVLLSQGEPDL